MTLEAETFEGVSHDENYGAAASAGWGSYEERTFSGEHAALTRADATMTARVPKFDKGTYRAEVAVLNYGGGKNVFDITIGGVTKRLRFGGEKSINGLTLLDQLYFKDVQDDKVSIHAVAVGQPYLVVDRVTLVRYKGKVPPARPEWERSDAEAQAAECPNCIEAESLKPVNPDPNYGVTSASGWASYAEGSYSGGRAAITRMPGAVMRGRIPKFRQGAYVVTVTATVQGTAKNTFEIQAGDETQKISFGGPGFTPGVTKLENIYFENVASDYVAIRAGELGQPYLIIDALSFQPATGRPAQQQSWSSAAAEPIDALCLGCVEAEALRDVSTAADYGTAASAGWASYAQDVYSGGRAALTRMPGAAMQGTIPAFKAGSYDLVVTVLDQVGGENVLEVTAGGVTKRISYPGKGAGLKRLPPVRFDGVKDASFTVRATAVGQPYAIVDNLSFRPAR